VDIVLDRRQTSAVVGVRLHEVPSGFVQRNHSDIVKTFLRRGFELKINQS